MKRILISALVLFLYFSAAYSQQWVDTYKFADSTYKNGENKAYAMTVDRNGNIYQAGFISSSAFVKHIILIKYSPSGVYQWSRVPILGETQDKAYAITIDDLDNVYITGYTKNISTNDINIVLLKYSGTGDSLWTRIFQGNVTGGEDKAYAIQIDEQNNVYIAGSSAGVNSGLDYLLLKYNPSGTLLWNARYNGTGNDDDVITAMVIDSHNDPVVTGYSKANHNSGTEDIVTIKYKSDGSRTWVNTFNGSSGNHNDTTLSDKAYAITVDRDDNVFIAGYITQQSSKGTDAAAIGYTPNGTLKWVTPYNGTANGDDIAYCIAATLDNNIVICGSSKNSLLAGSEDYITIDIHSHNGNIKWEERYNGIGNGTDIANCIALSPSDNEVYVSGYSQYGISNSRVDIVTLKYKIANGDLLDSSRFNYSGRDEIYPTSIIVDNNENVIIGGYTIPPSYNQTTTLGKKDNSDIITVGYSRGVLNHGNMRNSVKQTESNSKLFQNSPNPFNPSTLIKFYLQNSSTVRLRIYDMLGKEISILAEGNMEAGEHQVQFNGSNLSSGIYFYELDVNGIKDIKKMILVK